MPSVRRVGPRIATAVCLTAGSVITGVTVPTATAAPARIASANYISNGSGDCLTTEGTKPEVNSLITTSECERKAPQRWTLEPHPDGGFAIVHNSSGLCAESVAGLAAATAVKVSICGLGPYGSQRWYYLNDRRIRNYQQARDLTRTGTDEPAMAVMGQEPGAENKWTFDPVPLG
ncbi:RICIN domain-containing protein [Saccharothrix syringae]|nr:RICIN domain-containing protein [Saccharothrix syringae]